MQASKLISTVALSAVALSPLASLAQISPDPPQAAAEMPPVTLQEVTVTATRQAQPLSKVPASVTAFGRTQMDMQGVRTMSDLAGLTPGVQFGSSGYADTTSISIRGIGSGVGASTTGIYIDDTPVQVRSLGFAASNPYPEVFDLERVEILQGPQGTLFGAGSEGGTVRFITPQPSLTEYTGYARTQFATTEDGGPSEELGAAVGGPIEKGTLGFRASVWANHTGGYVDRVSPIDGSTLDSHSNWSNDYAARLAFAYMPVDWLTITPSVYYQQTYDHNSLEYFEYNGDYSDPANGVFKDADPIGAPSHNRFTLPTVKVEVDLGKLKFISVTSDFISRGDPDDQDYSHFMPTLIFGPGTWADGLTLPLLPTYSLLSQFYNKQDSFTQEFRLQSTNPDATISWIAGFFLQRARQQDTQLIRDPMLPDLVNAYFPGATVQEFFGAPMLNPNYSYISTDISHDNQDALFGELYWRITKKLKATVGLRYARTRFNYTGFQAGPWAGTTGLGAAGSENQNPVTPKFGLTYQINSGNMVYATAAKGFRVGGVNKPIPVTSDACRGDLTSLGLTQSPGQYGSDHLWSYEVGQKSNLLGDRLQVYSSAYYIKWEDIQQSVGLTDCGFNYVGNLGSAVSTGGDLSVQALVGSRLHLQLALAYNDAYYSKPTLGAESAVTGVRSVIVAEGDALPATPWTATFTGEYDANLFGQDSYARFTYEYGSRNSRLLPVEDARTTSYDPAVIAQTTTHLVNARIGVRFSGFDLSLFSNNLFNAHPILSRTDDVIGSPLLYDTTFTPRTIGVTGTYRF